MHAFRVASGAYESPYLLYTFSPLFLAAFLLSYRGAFIFASVESVLLIAGTYMGGYWVTYLAESGEHISTYFLFYFFIAFAMAYLADLLNKLEAINKKKACINNDLARGRKCLEISLAFNRLSDREAQVLMLSSEGKTVSQVASELGISENTIKTYLKRINDKLSVTSKKEAISKITGQED
ncbi:helix-turn-helix transcriptional regulator [Candidatus Aquicultor secundus]|uniref:response regulator transcription factor n=1 Tax=Candidatus Aquicultor secundus TaxID=1973895 RepID=UPI00257B7D54|nr:helix-turn-helix transcriptional regulator [Candidatus Aquicultor secundus]